MQTITRVKTARLHAALPPGRLLHDAVYQDHSEKNVRIGTTFERLLRKLAEKAHRIRQQHDLADDSPVIIIMDWVVSHSRDGVTRIKGHQHQCKNHPEHYIYFGKQTGSHISNLPHQMINPQLEDSSSCRCVTGWSITA